MRSYDDPVQVELGRVGECEAPARFVWRERLWRVCTVVSTWVETGPWWEHRNVGALLGAESGASTRTASVASLLGEREMWRVEATRGRLGDCGVFDLAFCWSGGGWRLVRCLD